MKFFVTVGRGTETFAEKEIKSKLHSQVETRDGKIIFQIVNKGRPCLDGILSLKCVERVFVMIIDYENSATGKKEFLNKLMSSMSTSENYDAAKVVLKQLTSLLVSKRMRRHAFEEASDDDEPCRKIARLHSSNLTPNSTLVKTQNQSSIGDNIEMNCEKKVLNTFRMSVKCSGKSGKWIDLKRLSRDLSWRVSKAAKWTVDLKNPDFEICVHINDHHVTAGIPLTRKPLSRRSFILDPGLRAPVAWIMTQLLEIKPGDIILDPMCGKGTLLLEACSCHSHAHYVGADNDMSQVKAAWQNIKRTGYEKHIDMIHANGLSLPFRSMSVNGVVCDAPFNQNHCTSKNVDEFYISFLKEMHRVLRRSGRFVLLTSQELSKTIVPLVEIGVEHSAAVDVAPSLPPSMKPLREDSPHPSPQTESTYCRDDISLQSLFSLVSKHYVKLGETHGEIIVMTKV